MNKTKNMLLVHGAAHDSSCWDLMIPLLEEQGYRVHTLTLSGHGNNKVSHFRVSVSTYAEDICAKARKIGSPVVLVGHSLGGASISMAAEKCPELFSQMVYLTAIVPDERGRSILTNSKKITNDNMEKAGKISLLNGSIFYTPDEVSEYFYNECSSEVKSKAARHLCAQPMRPFLSRLKWTEAKLGSIEKYYIECTLDNCIYIDAQRGMQNNMKFSKIASLKSDHSPFLSMPEQLAKSIAELVD